MDADEAEAEAAEDFGRGCPASRSRWPAALSSRIMPRVAPASARSFFSSPARRRPASLPSAPSASAAPKAPPPPPSADPDPPEGLGRWEEARLALRRRLATFLASGEEGPPARAAMRSRFAAARSAAAAARFVGLALRLRLPPPPPAPTAPAPPPGSSSRPGRPPGPRAPGAGPASPPPRWARPRGRRTMRGVQTRRGL